MPRPREFVRFAKSKAANMRSTAGGRPDMVPVSVQGQRDSDGLYIVKRDHWPSSILVPSSPRDAEIPYPRRMYMSFEEGSQQQPVLHWLGRNQPSPGPLGSGTPPAITYLWSHFGALSTRNFALQGDPGTDHTDVLTSDGGSPSALYNAMHVRHRATGIIVDRMIGTGDFRLTDLTNYYDHAQPWAELIYGAEEILAMEGGYGSEIPYRATCLELNLTERWSIDLPQITITVEVSP